MSNVSYMSGAAVLLAGREIVCPTHPPFRLKYGGGLASAATCRILHAGFSCRKLLPEKYFVLETLSLHDSFSL